jgi:uncharacterized protein YkwD
MIGQQLDLSRTGPMRMAALAPDLPKVELHIVEMTNQVRRKQNLTELRVNAMLAKAARAYAERLARSGQFSHTADGRNPGKRAESAGYKPCAVAENIAMDRNSQGFDSGQLAMQAVAGWMNSAPHRANILMASATEIGVGVAKSSDPVPKFISVEVFGRPASEGIKFEVVNASTAVVAYGFLGKTRDLQPRMTLTQSSCSVGEITFSKPAVVLSSGGEIGRFKAENGKRYILKSGVSGAISIEIGIAVKR